MGRKDDSISEAEHFLNTRQDVLLKTRGMFLKNQLSPKLGTSQ